MTAPVNDRAGVVRAIRNAAWHWRATSQGEDILAALEAAGLRVVPVEMTEAMVRAGLNAYFEEGPDSMWRAYLAASPFAPPKEDQT